MTKEKPTENNENERALSRAERHDRIAEEAEKQLQELKNAPGLFGGHAGAAFTSWRRKFSDKQDPQNKTQNQNNSQANNQANNNQADSDITPPIRFTINALRIIFIIGFIYWLARFLAERGF